MDVVFGGRNRILTLLKRSLRFSGWHSALSMRSAKFFSFGTQLSIYFGQHR